MDADATKFKSVRPTANLTEQVTQALISEITSGNVPPGTLLPSEQAMAKDFGVSRTVVREAVARAKAEGLVVTRQGRGVFVASNRPTPRFSIDPDAAGDVDQILHIVELRAGVEVEAAALAAERRDEDDVARLKAAVDAMHKALASKDVEAGVRADMDFHRAICQASGNPHFLGLFNFLSGFLFENISVSRRKSAKRAGRGYEAQQEHAAICDAVEKGDVAAARSAARRHIENTARRLTVAFENADEAGRGEVIS